jgi:hypothetical protein
VTKLQEPPDALTFYAQLQKLTSVAACSELFKLTVSPFAIGAFACGEVDLVDRNRSVMFIAEWPREWLRFYVASGFIERDPILNALQVCREPFSFSDLASDPKFSKTEREAMRLAAQHGWKQGLVVPVDRGGKRIGLVTLFGGGEEFDPLHRSFLCLASECLLNRVRALGHDIAYALPPGRPQHPRNRGGAPRRGRPFGRGDRRATRDFEIHRAQACRKRARAPEGEKPRASGRAGHFARNRQLRVNGFRCSGMGFLVH